MQFPIRYSKRAKNMSIVVHPGGRWEVVVPAKRVISEARIRSFVLDHESWIEKHVSRSKREKQQKSLSHRGVPRSRIEKETLLLVEQTIIGFRRHQPFTVNHIRLGNYKSQWGSCSSGFTLGFHYKLSLLPRELAEYIVAHELCHTIHFNHSKAFWELVETLCPNSKKRRKLLREFSP